MSELENKLYQALQDGYTLNIHQQQRLRVACNRVVRDHPNANFATILKAGEIYRGFILEFPDLTL